MVTQGSELHWGDILVILGYFVAVIFVGIWVSLHLVYVYELFLLCKLCCSYFRSEFLFHFPLLLFTKIILIVLGMRMVLLSILPAI